MRILHLDPDDIDNPMSGGGPRRTYEIYRRLAARHEITVLTPTFEGSTPSVVRDGVRFVRLGRKVGRHGTSHHFTFMAALPSAVRRYPYDLLVEDMMPPASATFVPLFAKSPPVASVQWFFANLWEERYRLPFTWGERYGIRLYSDFVVLTGAMRDLIQSRHPTARCTVIPEGADDDLFDIVPRRGDYVLFVGRVDFAQKGVDLLLGAYARVPEAERLPLVLAGHGFQWEAVERLVRELGLGGWVTMTGKVSLQRRAELLAGCRFAVAPSRDETFGMVILEACAAAVPVVLFDRAPMNEVGAPGACEFVRPFDVEAYAGALRRLLAADRAELARRGDACRRWASRYRWDAIARRQEELYLEVMDRRRPRPRRAVQIPPGAGVGIPLASAAITEVSP